MERLPSASNSVWTAGILASLAIVLALIGITSADISQIMSQVTAMVALYVVGGGPKRPGEVELGHPLSSAAERKAVVQDASE
ncbi:hypothetical protein ACQPZZ_01490 [Microbispora sp. CA-135349]|uniref:hypothetical protein n=1 Tax=Microbispora sp. CA-135349 TaxID=3239953 RepID=UPI003D94399F